MQQERILIIDDDRPNSDLMVEFMLIEGYARVQQAYDGQEGLEKYKAFLPDLVLMDMHMPVMDGYESSCRIKSFDPRAKILMLTGNPSDPQVTRTVSEGVVKSLHAKPLGLKDLGRVLRDNL